MKARKYPELWLTKDLCAEGGIIPLIIYPNESYEYLSEYTWCKGSWKSWEQSGFNDGHAELVCEIKHYPTKKSEKKWVPKACDIYYCIGADGEVFDDQFDDYLLDFAKLEFGNVFKTKKQATEARDKIKELLRGLR